MSEIVSGEIETSSWKESIIKIWQSRVFQFGMDICRVLLLIIAILIFYKLVSEIEIVKLLNSDPCKICMNKTGAICFYEMTTSETPKYYNYTEIDELISSLIVNDS